MSHVIRKASTLSLSELIVTLNSLFSFNGISFSKSLKLIVLKFISQCASFNCPVTLVKFTFNSVVFYLCNLSFREKLNQSSL